MALRDLHLLGSPVLRPRSADVETVDDAVREFIDDLFETMDAAKGVGLAANQVGVARRVAVVDADGTRFAMVNPVIAIRRRAVPRRGGLPLDSRALRRRDPPRADRARGARPRGQAVPLEAEGLVARAIQHEIDHLDGILFLDHLSPLKRQLLLAR